MGLSRENERVRGGGVEVLRPRDETGDEASAGCLPRKRGKWKEKKKAYADFYLLFFSF